MRLGFLLGLLTDGDPADVHEPRNVDQDGLLRHAWGYRFRWMRPADRELAVRAEVARYKRGEPDFWEPLKGR